jgi:hypothetical protein
MAEFEIFETCSLHCLDCQYNNAFLRPKVLGHRAHNLIRFKGMQGALDHQGDNGQERKVLLSRPLGMFTTVLCRDVPTRSIRLLR